VSSADDAFLNSDSYRISNDEGTQNEQKNEYLNEYLKERQNYLEEQLALHEKQVLDILTFLVHGARRSKH